MMKVLRLLVCALLLASMCSCFSSGGGDDNKQGKIKYNFSTCVKLYMEMAGPNADDGDRHSGEMMCSPCELGNARACKAIIDEMLPVDDYEDE